MGKGSRVWPLGRLFFFDRSSGIFGGDGPPHGVDYIAHLTTGLDGIEVCELNWRPR